MAALLVIVILGLIVVLWDALDHLGADEAELDAEGK